MKRPTAKLLTVIITFLNEKEEVGNTLESLFAYLPEEADVILINDGSDDGYDYRSIACAYPKVRYIENESRLGVAGSRDKGVGLCNTPYFLFLDAHMRFYDTEWYSLILSEMQLDDRGIICSQTRFLRKEGEILREEVDGKESFGAFVNLYDPLHLFEFHWLFSQPVGQEQEDIIDVPCIIGAAYACSKRYWLYVRGLWGLEQYGLDEPYLCIKIWEEGGRCKLMKNFVVGHIYRQPVETPYVIENTSRVYNKLLLLILLCPETFRQKCFARLRSCYLAYYREAFHLLYKKRKELHDIKQYYKEIRKYPFDFFYQKNYAHIPGMGALPEKGEEIHTIAKYLKENISSIDSLGIGTGKTGVVLFLFHYARYVNDPEYYLLAQTLLQDILTCVENSPADFYSGVYGIGWCMDYLYQHDFIEKDMYEKLDLTDRILSRIESAKWETLELQDEFEGVIRYVLNRLRTNRIKNRVDESYILIRDRLIEACKIIIEKELPTDFPDTCVELICEKEYPDLFFAPSSIYDLFYLFVPEEYQYEDFEFGMDGVAGIGLELILRRELNISMVLKE